VGDHLLLYYVFVHESGDTGADLVEFKALDYVGVRHTIKGLIFDPGVGSVVFTW